MNESSLQKREASTLTFHQEKALAFQGVPEDQWRIMVSFSKSSSANFARALKLAQIAPEYIESEHNGSAIYQATYTAEPKDFLAFVKLYEMVKVWKSCSVFINGLILDRKIIGNINYCYGDCCRSGKSDFCYGASSMTENPFGCHRLQISQMNHPWQSYYISSGDGKYFLNLPAMKERIDSFAQIYYLCPKFSYAKILQTLLDLPREVSKRKYQALCSYEDRPVLTLSIKMDVDTGKITDSKTIYERDTKGLPVCKKCGRAITSVSGICGYCNMQSNVPHKHTSKQDKPGAVSTNKALNEFLCVGAVIFALIMLWFVFAK